MISLLSNFTLNEEQEIRLKYDSIGMTVDMGENEYGEHSQLEALNKLSTGQLIVTNSGIILWNEKDKIGLSIDFSSIVLHALLSGEGSKVMIQVEAGSIQVDNGPTVLEEEDFDAEDDEFIASWDIVFELPGKDDASKLMSCISENWPSQSGSDNDDEEQDFLDELTKANE